MITVYRLCRQEHSPRSGAGASKNGGRWNPIGFEVIYAAATASLAALEILVHNSFLPQGYCVTQIQIPDPVAIETISEEKLPTDWQDSDYGPKTQQFGAQWIQQLRTAVLSVPSSVVPMERNFLINPAHRDFSLIRFAEPRAFLFDARLKETGVIASARFG